MKAEKRERCLHVTFVFIGATVLWNTDLQVAISFGVYYPEYIEFFQGDPRVIACIMTTTKIISLFAALLGAEITKQFGYRVTGLLSSLLPAAGFCLTALGRHLVFVFIGYGILTGSGYAFAIQATHFAIQTTFPEKRSMVSGLIGSLTTFCTLPIPILIRSLTDAYGWQGSMLIQAGIFLQGIPFIALMTVFARREATIQATSKETQPIANGRFGILRFLKETFDISILRDWRISLFYIGCIFLEMMVSVLYNLTIARTLWHGHSKFNASLLMTILCVGNASGRFLVGIVGDRFNRMALCALLTFLTGLLFIISALFSQYTLSCIFAGVIGLSLGGMAITVVTCVSYVTGEERLSKALGFVIFSVSIGGALALPLAELVTHMSGSYDITFHVTGCIGILSSVCFMIVYVSVKMRAKNKSRDELHYSKVTYVTETKDVNHTSTV